MKKFTIISAVVISCLGLGACFSKVHDLSRDELDVANNGALKYANAQGKRSLECSGLDSNKDGYVTCSMKDDNAPTVKPTEFVCSYSAVGCKSK